MSLSLFGKSFGLKSLKTLSQFNITFDVTKCHATCQADFVLAWDSHKILKT